MWQRIGVGFSTLGFGWLVVAMLWNWQPVNAASLQPTGLAGAGLITHVQDVDGRPLRVIVIDPAARVMGVYDISRDTGEIQLKSIRDLSADLQMLEFNSGAPSPADIKNSIKRK
ncbi:hypothetical protein Pla144_20970 [Bythopirellula polymerisocia]|uniref:Uncharacterized protein n=2 Tax=Bythopirellula polymerisocia TaxID=2528003 RepID=A0A5C6CTY8_9BACT|nr:hypothetical protein Pla144_20970 [Bythopirellula polymerisocia]